MLWFFFSALAMLWDCYIFTIVLRDRLALWFLFKDQMERSKLSNLFLEAKGIGQTGYFSFSTTEVD